MFHVKQQTFYCFVFLKLVTLAKNKKLQGFTGFCCYHYKKQVKTPTISIYRSVIASEQVLRFVLMCFMYFLSFTHLIIGITQKRLVLRFPSNNNRVK